MSTRYTYRDGWRWYTSCSYGDLERWGEDRAGCGECLLPVARVIAARWRLYQGLWRRCPPVLRGQLSWIAPRYPAWAKRAGPGRRMVI